MIELQILQLHNDVILNYGTHAELGTTHLGFFQLQGEVLKSEKFLLSRFLFLIELL